MTPAEYAAANSQLDATTTSQATIAHRSTIGEPVRIVWELCEANPQARRCDVVRLAEAAGVATYTARTQYQRWYSWNKSGRPTKA